MSEHILNNVNIFMLIEETTPVEVGFCDRQEASAKHRGLLTIRIGKMRITLSNVQYISELHMSLLLRSRMDTKGVSTSIGNGACNAIDRDENTRKLGEMK